MKRNNETPEEKRERLRQKELNHPASSIHGSNLSDSVCAFRSKDICKRYLQITLVHSDNIEQCLSNGFTWIANS